MKLPGEDDQAFYREIETHVMMGVGIIDACVEYCNQHKVEIEFAATMIANNPEFKARIQVEAETLKFLKKSKRIAI